MGEHVNGVPMRIAAWTAVAIVVALNIVLVVLAVRRLRVGEPLRGARKPPPGLTRLAPWNCPCARNCAGLTPYGAPQLDVPVLLNVNENPYAPPPSVVDAMTAAVHKAAEGLNRYPDRDFVGLRTDLANYLAREAHVDFLRYENIWAANGSNEVMLHLHQAFAGPGRIALSFDPTYSMYPEYARDSATTYVTLPRRDDFAIDVEAAVAEIAERKPDARAPREPQQPDGDGPPARRHASASRWRRRTSRVGASSSSTRRTRSSGGAGCRARSRCFPSFRTSPSPARCPRRSRSRAAGSATSRPARRSSTRSGSCGSRTT